MKESTAVQSFGSFKKEDFWKQQWDDKLQKYMTEKPKLGLLIHNWILRGVMQNVESICEVAAGSCVSSLYLSMFYDVIATDMYEYGFGAAKKRASSRNFRLKFQKENAFGFSFPQDKFDLVFHNGFFICFNSNKDINKLIAEQVRISKKYLLVVVHNKNDIINQYRFYRKAHQGDGLYRIRWYSKEEIIRLLQPYGSIQKVAYLSYPVIDLFRNSGKIPASIRSSDFYKNIWLLSIWRQITFGDRLVVLLKV
ncbi:MAG: class I SAM-dependent methyltransferase [Deltaproteobacteria bacterium]|nr:class I SAM-dependent methyltransferase [Deltaproteobacteria bacterium]